MNDNEALRTKIAEIVCYYSDRDIMRMPISQRILAEEHNRRFDELLDLFHQEQIKLIEEFERIIGEDEEEFENDSTNGEPADDVRTIYQAQVRNELKEEQRVKLEDLKKTL